MFHNLMFVVGSLSNSQLSHFRVNHKSEINLVGYQKFKIFGCI